MKPSDIERFWAKIDVGDGEGCWLWTAYKLPWGYGLFDIRVAPKQKQSLLAHRVMWFLSRGSWPALYICHSCHIPSCVNPQHLREGSQQSNLDEAAALGRMDKLPQRKLTAEQVALIRAYSTYEEAREGLISTLGVTRNAIYNAWHYNTYRDLP